MGKYKFKQKFLRGYRVKIADKMPEWMTHFQAGCEAIVEYTYFEKFGGTPEERNNDYCVIILDDKGCPVSSVSWYDVCQLTLVSDDILAGYKIIEQYNFHKAQDKGSILDVVTAGLQ